MPLHEQVSRKFDPERINVSGGGFVQLVNVNGSDAAIDTIARTEFDEVDPRMPDTVDGLLSYMIRHVHTSPFEFAGLTFQIRCPLFVRAQWMRHRTGHYSEVSGRYRDVAELGAYAPTRDHLRRRAPSRKQGSSDELVSDPASVQEKWRRHHETGVALYNELVTDQDLSKEVARGVLGQSNFTHFYFQMDLHNMLHFLRLRLDGTTQFQTREYAEALAHYVGIAFPITYRNYTNHILRGVRFSADELQYLQIDESMRRTAESRLGSSRYREFLEKVDRINAEKHKT